MHSDHHQLYSKHSSPLPSDPQGHTSHTMFHSTSTLPSVNEHTHEQVIFVPLEAGVVSFPLTRVAVPMPDQSPKSFFDYDDEDEVAQPTKSLPKLASAAAIRITKVFRRRHACPTQSDDVSANIVPTLFTSPDNWRPGLLTLEQAACRADIVKRPEIYERV